MAETGINWTGFNWIHHVGTSQWNAVEITDGSSLTGEPTEDGNFMALEYSVTLTDAGSGTFDGDVIVSVLGSIDGTNFEATGWELRITPVSTGTRYKRFAVSPRHYGQHKIKIENDAGDSLNTTVMRRTGQEPKPS